MQTEYKLVDRQRVKALQVIKKSCVIPHTHDLRSFRKLRNLIVISFWFYIQ